ncbi:MAG TPA: metallopeptidase family protein [Alphaproteobacteria bacterium]|nr:metallopeptidase family protein [Alphaproteobacteria bacterium]
MGERALASIPPELSRHVRGVAIVVEDFPDEETLDAMGCETEFDLLGLYSGVDLTRKTGWGETGGIDRIFLYRRPILDYWCETGEDLEHVVRHVLIHEIGHHFGLSDDDMERIEAGAPD